MNPRLSIIIPVYNVEHCLEQCLNSVLHQSLKGIEVLCINDGSTDGSMAILQRFQEKDERLKIIQGERAGQGVARNKGIALAKGAYIGFVDADDWVELIMFEAMYQAAIRHHSDMVWCFTDCFDSSTNRRTAMAYFDQERNVPGSASESVYSRETIPAILPWVTIVAWNKIYRASFLREQAIYFDTLTPHEDVLFSFQALLRTETLVLIRQVYYHYRVNGESSTMNSFTTTNYQRILDVLRTTETAIADKLDSQEVKEWWLLFKIKQLLHSLNAALLNPRLSREAQAVFFRTVRKNLTEIIPPSSGLDFSERIQLRMIRYGSIAWFRFRLQMYRMKNKLFNGSLKYG